MPKDPAPAEWGVWEAEPGGLRIEYSRAVLEEIRGAAVEGFLAAPHGGVEVGGVLLGEFRERGVRIAAQRPLPCEHARGPGFLLSEPDQAALARMLEEAAAGGLHAVGWYHSHTRSELALSAEDWAVHRRHFPDPRQVALLVRPYGANDVRAAFFCEDAAQAGRPAAAQEFSLAPFLPGGRRKPAVPAEPAPARKADSPPAQAGRRVGGGGWRPLVLAALLLEGAGLAAWSYYAGSDAPLGLKAAESDGRLEICWDPNAPAVRRARRVTLQIADGPENARLELSPPQVRTGRFSRSRQSDRVEVRLRLERWWGAPLEEAVLFVGERAPLPEPPEAEALREALRERDQLAAELERLRRELRSQRARTAQLEQLNRLLRQRLEIEAARGR